MILLSFIDEKIESSERLNILSKVMKEKYDNAILFPSSAFSIYIYTYRYTCISIIYIL